MVIREKALIREMKEAYKKKGYTVAAQESGKTIICTEDWIVRVDDAEVPREALALMALHMGFLPEDGEAYVVQKGDKQPIVQEEDFEEAVAFFESIRLVRISQEKPKLAGKTPLIYGARNVWQMEEGQEILLVHPNYEHILYRRDEVQRVGEALYIGDDVSEVVVVCDNRYAPEDIREHLAKMKWAKLT